MNKENYHVQIKPEFLFDEYEIFDSNYSTWVFLSLKIKYNYFLQHAPNKTFKIEVDGMANYYATSPATIYESLKELQEAGLLEKRKSRYRLLDENEYMRKFRKVDITEGKKYPKFMKIYDKAVDDLIFGIKMEIDPTGSNKRLIVKCLKLYFYLMARDRHCLLDNESILKSCLTQTSLEKELGMDHRVIKLLLNVLKSRGYIKIEEGKIFTLNKETYDPGNYTFKKNEEESYEPEYDVPSVIEKPVQSTVAQVEAKTVPNAFIGYRKSDDGKVVFIIFYSKRIKAITIRQWCKGDGVRPTFEEYNIGNELFEIGKRSKYYDPENYWLYPEDIESLKKAA